MSSGYLSEGIFTFWVGACALNNLLARENLQLKTGERRAYRIFQNTSQYLGMVRRKLLGGCTVSCPTVAEQCADDEKRC